MMTSPCNARWRCGDHAWLHRQGLIHDAATFKVDMCADFTMTGQYVGVRTRAPCP